MANEKRLIDANRFEKLLLNHITSYLHKEDVIAALANQPTVDAVDAVEVVHGQWRYGYCVNNGEVVYHSINCSECDGVFRDKSLEIVQRWESQFKICPFCGAKMDLEE